MRRGRRRKNYVANWAKRETANCKVSMRAGGKELYRRGEMCVFTHYASVFSAYTY